MRTWFSLLLLGSLVIAGTRHLELSDPVPPEVAARAGDNLVMYTTTHCPYCAVARAWLAKNGIAYRVFNTETSEECLAQFERLGADGVPTLVFEGHMQIGWDSAWLREVLAHNCRTATPRRKNYTRAASFTSAGDEPRRSRTPPRCRPWSREQTLQILRRRRHLAVEDTLRGDLCVAGVIGHVFAAIEADVGQTD